MKINLEMIILWFSLEWICEAAITDFFTIAVTSIELLKIQIMNESRHEKVIFISQSNHIYLIRLWGHLKLNLMCFKIRSNIRF